MCIYHSHSRFLSLARSLACFAFSFFFFFFLFGLLALARFFPFFSSLARLLSSLSSVCSVLVEILLFRRSAITILLDMCVQLYACLFECVQYKRIYLDVCCVCVCVPVYCVTLLARYQYNNSMCTHYPTSK